MSAKTFLISHFSLGVLLVISGCDNRANEPHIPVIVYEDFSDEPHYLTTEADFRKNLIDLGLDPMSSESENLLHYNTEYHLDFDVYEYEDNFEMSYDVYNNDLSESVEFEIRFPGKPNKKMFGIGLEMLNIQLAKAIGDFWPPLKISNYKINSISATKKTFDEIIGSPETYSGKYVSVSGCLHLSYEGNTLCKSSSDLDNCLYVRFSRVIDNELLRNEELNAVNLNGYFEINENIENDTGQNPFIRGTSWHNFKHIDVVSKLENGLNCEA